MKQAYNYDSNLINETILGMNAFFVRVYAYVGLGLFLSAVSAYVGHLYLIPLIISGKNFFLFYVVMFLPLVFIFVLSVFRATLSFAETFLLYLAFVVTQGVALSYIFYVYEMGSILNIFLITGILFVSLSIYGYSTDRDVTGWGGILFGSVIGILVLILFSFFIPSDFLQKVISLGIVIVFSAFIIYDTKRAQEHYVLLSRSSEGRREIARGAIFWAVRLYLNFINVFIALLRLFGNRR